MAGKQNQVIAVARFLLYKSELNKRLERMSDEEYLKKGWKSENMWKI